MAESGWDFSSRWLAGNNLTSTKIDKIIPSDFNALMGMMEQYLAELS
jgi:alpha,alpha-trehalase